jgi:hypothetical protein
MPLQRGFWNGYATVSQSDTKVDELAALFPSLCQSLTLPRQTAGLGGPLSIKYLRINTTPTIPKRGVLFVGGVHAREWINPNVCLELAEQLLRNYDPLSTDPDVVAVTSYVNNLDIIIIPVANPEGVNYSFSADALWRKNRRDNPTNSEGVDNNRNYLDHWGGKGSSGSYGSNVYRGPSGFSEPEDANLMDLKALYPLIAFGIDHHSYGEQVLFSPAFDQTAPLTADESNFVNWGNQIRDAIALERGTVYFVGHPLDAAAMSCDWGYYGKGIFMYIVECAKEFQPAWSEAAMVVLEVVRGSMKLCDIALNYVEPSATNTLHSGNVTMTTTGSSNNKKPVAQVTVHDENHNAVAGATVTGDFTGFKGTTAYLLNNVSATTNSSGVATLVGPAAKSQTSTFTVRLTTKDGYGHRLRDNEKHAATITY